MVLSNLHAWRTYLATRGHTQDPPYRYPADEALTDDTEAHQDPTKRQRELESISHAAPAHAELVCDFGCGVGRNFETLRKSVSEDALLIGIEPDSRRRRIAARNAQGFRVLAGSIELVAESPHVCKVDHFLCCQVLGHTPTAVTREIISIALARLSHDGTAHFCIPFVNAALHDTVDDFYHAVNLKLTPDDPNFRVRLAQEEFNRISERGTQREVLPVRAFSIQVPEGCDESGIPLCLDELPEAFVVPAAGSFRSATSIYSVHAWHEGVPYVGDISVVIRRHAR